MAARQLLTRQWWNEERANYQLVVFQFVLDEAAAGDPTLAAERLRALLEIPLLPLDPAIADIADEIMRRSILPEKARTDALMLAIERGSDHACSCGWLGRRRGGPDESRCVRRQRGNLTTDDTEGTDIKSASFLSVFIREICGPLFTPSTDFLSNGYGRPLQTRLPEVAGRPAMLLVAPSGGCGDAAGASLVRRGSFASVAGLPGCHSQGATEDEAIENIRAAIREDLEVVEELAHVSDAKGVTVEV